MPDRHGVSGRLGRTAYTLRGEGPPVVLIHGVGLTREIWASLADELARDYQVLTYDMLGHGGSELPPDQARLSDYADQLIALLDGLGWASASIVGHSMGALVALETALSHPARVRGVVAISAVFQRTPEQRRAVLERAESLRRAGLASSVEPTIRRWFGDPVPGHLREAAAETLRQLSHADSLGYARTYQVFATSDDAHVARLESLKVPALFMTAEFDANSTPAMSQTMHRQVTGSACVVVPEAGHMLILTHRACVLAELRGFLQRAR